MRFQRRRAFQIGGASWLALCAIGNGAVAQNAPAPSSSTQLPEVTVTAPSPIVRRPIVRSPNAPHSRSDCPRHVVHQTVADHDAHAGIHVQPPGYLKKYRRDQETGKTTYAVIQAEDELAALGMVIGAGWMGARACTSTAGPGVSLRRIGFVIVR